MFLKEKTNEDRNLSLNIREPSPYAVWEIRTVKKALFICNNSWDIQFLNFQNVYG